MDEAERLLTLAALGGPDRAPAAWAEWRRTVPQAEASGLLMWAGGYINRNLRAAGVEDPYLAGIARYNFLRNNTRVLAALPIIRELTSRFEITPMKSFGMSEAVSARSLRPLADFDFYVSSADLEAVRRRLREAGLVPLLGVDDDELGGRILAQRGSWNFLGADEVDLDLHWRVFDHLDLDLNARLVAENSRLEESEFGRIRRMNPELMTATLAVHAATSGTQRGSFFDIVHVVGEADVDRLARLVRAARLEREISEVHDILRGVLGDDAGSAGRVLGAVVGRSRRRVPHATRRLGPTRFMRVPARFREPARWRRPLLTRVWALIGRPTLLERLAVAFGGPLAAPEEHPPSGDLPRGGFRLGAGWLHLYPRDGYRWAMLPDARAVRDVAEPTRALVIELDPAWQSIPNSRVEVFVNGRRVGRMTRDARSYRFPIDRPAGTIEVSLRPQAWRRFRDPGIFYRDYGFLAPIARLDLE